MVKIKWGMGAVRRTPLPRNVASHVMGLCGGFVGVFERTDDVPAKLSLGSVFWTRIET